ncbi:MAG: helix-turn-helix domain-containing protein [Nitrososphaerales archaeon]
MSKAGLLLHSLEKGTWRSVQTVSAHLARLRTADLVLYETEGRRTHYRLKQPFETRQLVEALHAVVVGAARMADLEGWSKPTF